jgi:hypothetical protein
MSAHGKWCGELQTRTTDLRKLSLASSCGRCNLERLGDLFLQLVVLRAPMRSSTRPNANIGLTGRRVATRMQCASGTDEDNTGARAYREGRLLIVLTGYLLTGHSQGTHKGYH